MDGKLYKVNKSTGEETLVGATGLTLTNLMGQYYGQSGEIDQRDDTFYWYCIDNKAGVVSTPWTSIRVRPRSSMEPSHRCRVW